LDVTNVFDLNDNLKLSTVKTITASDLLVFHAYTHTDSGFVCIKTINHPQGPVIWRYCSTTETVLQNTFQISKNEIQHEVSEIKEWETSFNQHINNIVAEYKSRSQK
jgi:hypothetical protein